TPTQGYIGGSVLTRLLSHTLSDTFQITVLVRDPAKATQFRMMGIKAVIGSYQDTTLLKRLSSEADYVFACADADDLDAAKAILEGLKERHDKTGQSPSLIHTVSYLRVLVDNERGMHSTDKVYSDLNIPLIESLPDSQPHRIVDRSLVEADNQGYVHTYIILPGTIYGEASGPLVDLGVQNAYSQQIPRLVKLSLQRGQAGMVGEGKNTWPNVHIDDVADLYIHLFDLILPTDANHRNPHRAVPAHGRSGFYFAENGEHHLVQVGKAIGQAMHEFGLSSSPRPMAFTEEEMDKFFPNGTSLGTNSRCKAERSKKLGWRPRKTTKDMVSSVREEVKRLGNV
ncbi:hypothetical protein AMATHDRAFT_138304, partial [Amanita thiersii Skay4041]